MESKCPDETLPMCRINPHTSRKHAYIILTPLTPLLYSKTGVYRSIHFFFLFLLKNIDCGYSLEPPLRGGSNEYHRLSDAVLTSTHTLCFEQKYEKYQIFLSENFQFLDVKFSIYLNRRVYVMFGAFWKVCFRLMRLKQ